MIFPRDPVAALPVLFCLLIHGKVFLWRSISGFVMGVAVVQQPASQNPCIHGKSKMA